MMERTRNAKAAGFVVLSEAGNILCTDGEWYSQRFLGPGGHNAKVWKTRAGAERVRVQLGRGGRVEPLR